ncbi:MAG TPA: PPC domain-containing protein [Flavisolibacter sp.]|nr:PPC domain-containing protein [Flavisolibacter sp.]
MKRWIEVFFFTIFVSKIYSQDSIQLSTQALTGLFSKRVGSHLTNNDVFSSTDTIGGIFQKPFGTVVQAKLSKINNALLTVTRFKEGNITAKILKDSSIYYEWNNGVFIKKASPVANYNGENLISPDLLKLSITIPSNYYSPNLSEHEKDSIMVANGAICIYYDFDGQTVEGTAWNYNGAIVAAPSIVSTDTAAMDFILNYGREQYYPFNIIVTRDSTLYFLAQRSRRIRVIFTPTYDWYCGGTTACAGGVSYVGSLFWADDTPSWAFDAINTTRGKAIVGAHEAAHQFGLQHFDTNGFGSGENGLVPLLNQNSNIYSKNMTLWWKGTNVINVPQDDAEMISSYSNLGRRLSDVGTTFNTAKYLSKDQITYSHIGLKDSDYYKIDVPSTQTITISITPKSNGSGSRSPTNADALLDAAIDLYDNSHTLIASSNDTSTLNASLSQSLTAGTYFIKVRCDRENVNNPSAYGFMGHYWITYTY